MQSQHGFATEERSFTKGERIDAQGLQFLKNWYPVSICEKTSDVFWRDLGEQRFHASFFQNTLNEQTQAQRRVCKTPISALGQFHDFIEPTAFVFHVSRCGSTLLTQILSTLHQCIVLSEPPVIDSFFRQYNELTEKNIHLFRQLISALGQRRFTSERHLIIKLDSWHLGRFDFIRQAFPQTPLLFLYRNPQQVLASHQRQRGPQMIPNFVDMGNLNVDQKDLSPGDLDAYCLRVLDQFYTAAIKHNEIGKLQLINYQELPKAIWERLVSQLKIEFSASELEQMKARSERHSKHPHQSFQGEAKSEAKHVFFNKTHELYLQLENLRQLQNKTALY
nr:hypothetical protein [uncultured Undibacterium sp.]